MFFYSLIFSYVFNKTKENISSKYASLLYIPFCIPLFLIYNHSAIRNIYHCWILIFLLSYILFNKNKKIDSVIMAMFIGIISSVGVSYRMEFMSIFLIVPLFIFFSKLFAKKAFILFLIV